MKTAKIIIFVFVILILLGAGFYFAGNKLVYFWKNASDFYSKFTSNLPVIKDELKKQISAPPPIRSTEEHPESFLTKDGVFRWTNIQRGEYGFQPLKTNKILDDMAKAKAQDMFSNQYFAHESPVGQGAADLAEDFGYQFLAIGENLAMGNFKNDESLVDAWMASEGHRKNMLSGVYQEIGVAVEKGIFEGKTTWLAVQHFGLSADVCLQPDFQIKSAIDEVQNQILVLEAEIAALEEEIKMAKSEKEMEEYRQKVDEYNSLVGQHNSLIKNNKILINSYNSQIDLFNRCIAGYLNQ